MARIIDPWGSELIEDYVKIIKDFGLEEFRQDIFLEPNTIMKRGIVFAGRDMKLIAKCIREKKPFYALTGIMPTNEQIHFGTKLVVENLKYFQEHGAITFILVADLEASVTRGVTLEEAKKRALEFHIPAYIALGLNPEKTVFYFQSENKEVVHLAFRFAQNITLNEFRAIYGNADPGRIMAAATQIGDILYPQLKERMPGIIPVGIDQDPHIRLTRDVVGRNKRLKFFLPSSIYHKYMPSLDGDLKMSKSKPESCLSLPESEESVTRKLKKAKTGGRDTAEEQRKKGGEPDKCIIFEMDKQHLMNDKELQNIYGKCISGQRLCGECKKICIDKMCSFMKDFKKGIAESKKKVKDLKFIKFN